MLFYILIFFVVFLIYYFISNHIHIKVSTFFHKGFIADRSKFGVYCFDGKQGQGKTMAIVRFLHDNSNYKIYCNLKSIKGVDYTYFSGFSELLKLQNEHDCIIVYDEIFTALTRTSKINTDVLSFLSQMRKKHIIFLTTAQEWLEINITLRRYCRYRVSCSIRTFPFIPFSIIIKQFYDAEKMKWDNLENEYVAPLIDTVIEKTNLFIAESYDTNEEISSVNKSPVECPINSDTTGDFGGVLRPPKGVICDDLKIDNNFWSDFAGEKSLERTDLLD